MSAKTGLRNPYIAGRALGQDRGFFGRENILRLVETTLRKPDQNALVLFGQRRIGKTSILLQLQRRLPSPPFLPVYFDLMDRARRPLGQVLYEIASTIAAEADMAPLEREKFDDQGAYFRRVFLPAVYQALGAERSPVLLLDEFDVLDVAAEEQMPPTAAAQAFFPYLRELLEGEPHLKFVFVVGRRAEDLSINVKAAFKASVYQRVSVLDETSTIELVATAERQNSLTFSPQATERILALTSGHPYFVQLLCQLLWDTAYATNPQAVPSIDVAQVERAAIQALEAGQNIFEWIWDGLPPAERLIFAAIAEATSEQSVVTEDQLSHLLQSYGVRILTRELELAPRTLVDWDMLSKVDGGYRFFIELMRRWVAINKPLPRVKDELDRIVPLADTLYRGAEGFYRQGDLESAQDQLRKALHRNPNHLKARLLLGETLVEQGNIDEALRELEEAYHYDEDATRYPLVRALLAQGQEFERDQKNDDALAAYERALKISPREKVALERRAAIWSNRGDAATKAGNLAVAIDAYKMAGTQDKVVEAEHALRRRMLEQQADEARRYERGRQWDRAIEVYQRLSTEDPAEPQWRDALARIEQQRRSQELERWITMAHEYERKGAWDQATAMYAQLVEQSPDDQQWASKLAHARVEQELHQKYAAALAACAEQNWLQALPLLADIVRVRPDYKEAADMLARAVQRQRHGIPRSSLSYATILGIAGLVIVLLIVGWSARSMFGRITQSTVAATQVVANAQTATAAAATTQVVANAQTATAAAATTQVAANTQTATAAVANAQTATAAAANAQTAIAIVQATAQLQATNAAWAQKPALILETFDDNSREWDVGEFSSERLRIETQTIADGKYHWQTESLKDFIDFTSPEMYPISDFYLSVDAVQISGGSKSSHYGVAFRESVDKDDKLSRYVFIVANNKSFYIGVLVKNVWTPLVNWTSSAAIRPSQTNRLAVIAEGEHFSFYINGELVRTLNDSTLNTGTVGLVVQSSIANEKATFDFDNFEVHQ